MNGIDVKSEVLEAEKRIRPYILETPLEYSPYLSQLVDSKVYLKLENQQITKSFKLRGALNKILSLSDEDRKRGLLTASSGNHGAAFAYTMDMFGIEGTIYLPTTTSQAKREALKAQGADVVIQGDDCVLAEKAAKEEAERRGKIFISPYNDSKIIGGQGTIALELQRQPDKIDVVLTPLGGGGLASGLAGYLKAVDPGIEIIGCQPENSAVMYESVKAGRILNLESKPTLSDGSAGGIEQGSITFDICRRLIDDYILVSEDEILQAILLTIERHHMLVEGAAVLAVASLLKKPERFRNKTVVLIISGARIGLEKIKEIMQ